jgi:hypothetical protein
MQHATPRRCAVVALLAMVALATAATPVLTAGDSASTAPPMRHTCPPIC